MSLCLILVILFTQSFAQSININCSSNFPEPGYNSSFLALLHTNGVPTPYSLYRTVYNNGTYFSHEQLVGGDPAYSGTAIINTSESNNENFDCYQYTKWIDGSLSGLTLCYGYSIISFGANAFAYIGCYDYTKLECPIACTSQYILSNNRAFYGQFYLNNIDGSYNQSALIVHPKFTQNVDCNAIKGFHTTTIWYDVDFAAHVGYASVYSNGTYIEYDQDHVLMYTATYNVSQATNSNGSCHLYVMFDPPVIPNVQCHTFSFAMDGSARIGCTSNDASCPASCNPQFILQNGNIWWTSFALDPLDNDPTHNLTTNTPTTTNPTTTNPTTFRPTTNTPSTINPTTSIPTTNIPTTTNPTPALPTTFGPTTSMPITNTPTTSNPTTTNATTTNPSTFGPTTTQPTTNTPSTTNPTTFRPTTNPTNEGMIASIQSTEIGDEFSSNDSSFLQNNMLYIIIASVSLLICIMCFICYCYIIAKKKQNKLIMNKNDIEVEQLERINSIQSISATTPAATEKTNTTTNDSNPNENGENELIDPFSNENTLKVFLANLDLSPYYDIFVAEGFNAKLSMLYELNDDDLKQIGINKMADRKAIIKQIQLIKKGDSNYVQNDKNDEIESDGSDMFGKVSTGHGGETHIVAEEDDHDGSDELLYQKGDKRTTNR